jgi:hypothetical protein
VAAAEKSHWLRITIDLRYFSVTEMTALHLGQPAGVVARGARSQYWYYGTRWGPLDAVISGFWGCRKKCSYWVLYRPGGHEVSYYKLHLSLIKYSSSEFVLYKSSRIL